MRKVVALIVTLAAAGAVGCGRQPTTPLERAERHIAVDEWNDAVAILDELLQQDPHNVHALILRGQALLATNRPAEAVRDFSEAARLRPNDADAYYLRAKAYEKLGDLESSLADHERARNFDPAYRTAYLNELPEEAPMGLPGLPERPSPADTNTPAAVPLEVLPRLPDGLTERAEEGTLLQRQRERERQLLETVPAWRRGGDLLLPESLPGGGRTLPGEGDRTPTAPADRTAAERWLTQRQDEPAGGDLTVPRLPSTDPPRERDRDARESAESTRGPLTPIWPGTAPPAYGFQPRNAPSTGLQSGLGSSAGATLPPGTSLPGGALRPPGSWQGSGVGSGQGWGGQGVPGTQQPFNPFFPNAPSGGPQGSSGAASGAAGGFGTAPYGGGSAAAPTYEYRVPFPQQAPSTGIPYGGSR